MPAVKAGNQYRYELALSNPGEFKQKVERSGYVAQKFQGNRVTRFIVKFDDYPIDVRILSKKAVLLCTNSAVIDAFLNNI